jgi:hypothetical protein
MGFFEDTPAVMVEIFVLAIVAILMFFVVSTVSGLFDVIPGYNNAVGHEIVQSFPIMDQGILLVFIFMMLVTLILAWYIPSHPALLIGYVVLVILLVLLAPIFVNVYSIIVNNSFIAPFADKFPITNQIISNLPLEIVLLSAMVAIVAYGKPRTDQAGVLSGIG